MSEPLLTLSEAAKALAIADDALRGLCRRREIRHCRIGNRIRFKRSWIDEYLGSEWTREYEKRQRRPKSRIRPARKTQTRDGLPHPASLGNVPDLVPVDLTCAFAGIYFLCHMGSVVYVGKSGHVLSRVVSHITERDKIFDSVYAVRMRGAILTVAENAFIRHLRPKYNGVNW